MACGSMRRQEVEWGSKVTSARGRGSNVLLEAGATRAMRQ